MTYAMTMETSDEALMLDAIQRYKSGAPIAFMGLCWRVQAVIARYGKSTHEIHFCVEGHDAGISQD
jgi:anthranilate/para-aminobenzoate synthase component II